MSRPVLAIASPSRYRNNDIDIYQIQFRFRFEGPTDDRKGCEMDIETRTSISIQTGNIYRQRIRRTTKDRGESS